MICDGIHEVDHVGLNSATCGSMHGSQHGTSIDNGVFNYQYMVCEEDRHRANMIGELVQVRDGQLHLHISQCELCTFIEYVCMM